MRQLNFNLKSGKWSIQWHPERTFSLIVHRNGKKIDFNSLSNERKSFFRKSVQLQEAKIQRETFRKTQNLFYAHSPQGKAEHEKEQRMASAMQRLKRLLKK